jgi:hypothetical protein
VILNAHRALEVPEGIQAIGLCRDTWKAESRLLLMLAPMPTLPIELAGDVLTLDDPLPTEAEHAAMVARECGAACEQLGIPAVPDDAQRSAVSALIGLPAYAAEQAVALSLIEREKLEAEDLWSRKKAAIKGIPGLKMDDASGTLDDLGGLAQVIGFFRRLMAGKDAPDLFVRMEEIEKAMAGAGGDLSGTSTDQLQQVLTNLEERGWSGAILCGAPGSGKSWLSRILGASFGKRTISLDLGACKGSLVGQSEERIRRAMDTIAAMGGRRVFFLASCNKLETLPPELRRRFRAGIWFFDLPSPEERAAIWALQLRAFGLPADSALPADDGWTGAEIRNACEWASRLDISPADAAPYIVPVSKSDPDSIERLRKAAAGRWLSASYPGAYRLPSVQTVPAATARRYAKGADDAV